jgi:uncharacterized protein (DUF1697 family)
MNTYIALLRGINVSGHKLIRMELLRKALAELGYADIATYIQSGNIIFKSDIKDPKILETQIADKIEQHFSFTVPVIIVTPSELKSVVNNNPYAGREISDPAQPYIAFLSGKPANGQIAVLKGIDFGRDEFTVIDKSVYILYADSAGNTKLTNTALENKLMVKATSRNWKTIHKLIEMTADKQ